MSLQLRKELANAIGKENYDVTPNGIYFPNQSVLASGEYFERINGGEWEPPVCNLVVTQGLAHVISVALGTSPRPAGYFLALFNGSAAPDSSWTAANFSAVAGEITSMTEGYTSPTRPEWTPPASTTTNSIDNMATVAQLTFATSDEVIVTGVALLTNSARGGTTGALISATKYPAQRKFQNGDTYDLGYRFSLTV